MTRLRRCIRLNFWQLRTELFLEQSPKKVKKEKDEVVIAVEDLSPIAHPLAQKKLVKKLHKTIKKGSFRLHVSWFTI